MTPAMLYLEGWRPILAAPAGRKWLNIVTLDSRGVRVIKMPRTRERDLREVTIGTPSKRTAKHFARSMLRSGKSHGISKAAREMLRAALAKTDGGAE